MNQEEINIIISEDLGASLQKLTTSFPKEKIFVLTDVNTQKHCAPMIAQSLGLSSRHYITIKAGDEHKNLSAIAEVWEYLSNHGADRKSLLINLGGGMITDLGGFAASTFKRGISFINVPTTLLSIVDAAVGGKTGINFNGLKNEIGVIRQSGSVLIETRFLNSLDHENFLSGYAEMIKHSLLDSKEEWQSILDYDLKNPDLEALKPMVRRSIAIKEAVVKADPYEKGIRKSLNLGHTIGHAYESLSLEKDNLIPHGYAVAFGLISELYLSVVKLNFPKEILNQAIELIRPNYEKFYFDCNDYSRLFEFLTHDKKNENNQINFSLMNNIGDVKIDCNCTKEEIFQSFDFYRDTFKI